MSSYINSSKHFNSVQDKLESLLIWNHDNFYTPYKIKSLYPEIYDRNWNTEVKKEKITGIIDTLRKLQVLCVSLQYAHHHEGTLDKEIQEQTEIVMCKKEREILTTHGLYNAIGCIGYQIEAKHLKELRELTEEESKALEFLEIMRDELAHHLVSKLPEDKTRWSIE
jgi:hypothetical protein